MPKTIDWMLVATIFGPILAIAFGAWLTHIVEGRSRLLSYFVHSSAIVTNRQPGGVAPMTIHTHSIVVKNSSRKPANNVRLGHKVLPDFTIHPPIHYDVVALKDGSYEIVIPKMIRSEQLTISYLYFPPVIWDQINTYTKSDEGFAKIIPVQLMMLPPKSLLIASTALTLIGASTVLYFAAQWVRSLM